MKSLKDKLYNHINSTDGWIRKGSFYDLADQWGYSPESVGRKLRLLEEEGKIFVKYYDGTHSKNLAMYSRKSPIQQKLTLKEVIKPDGTRVMAYE